MNILLLPIIIPFIAALIVLLAPSRTRFIKEGLSLLATLACVIISFSLFKKSMVYALPWAGFGIDFNLRLDHFSGFILAASAGFSFLISLYCTSFMQARSGSKQFYAYLLITLSFVSGAVLSDNLILMLV